MPVSNDPFDVLESAIHVSFFIGVIFVICLVFVRRKRAKRRGGYATCSSLGFALQHLQAIARPAIEHQLKEQQQEKLKEDDEGGPDDPTRYYRRLREKVDEECAKQE
jgi:hypothetical protein